MKWLTETDISSVNSLDPNEVDPNDKASKDCEKIDETQADNAANERQALDIAGKRFMFGSPADVQYALSSLSAFKESYRGNEDVPSDGNTATNRGIAFRRYSKARYGALAKVELEDAEKILELYRAALLGSKELLKLNVSQGVNIHVAIGFYGTPLTVACTKGNATSAKLLLNAGADITATEGLFGDALGSASACGYLKIVEILLTVLAENDAYNDAKKNSIDTALLRACEKRHAAIVRVLLDNGADPNATWKNGRSALYISCRNGDATTAKLLLDKGVKVDFLEGHFRPEIVSLLVAARVDFENGMESIPSREKRLLPPQRNSPRETWGQKEVKLNKPQEGLRALMSEPIKEPPPLPSCGCIVCFIDQQAYSAMSRSLPRMSFRYPSLKLAFQMTDPD